MNSLLNLSPKQLREAASLKERIDSLQNQLKRLLGGSAANGAASMGGRKMSAAAIARIRRAAKARWAKIKGKATGKPRRKMSAAAKAHLAAIARARWKRAKASGKSQL